jgi:hypothetical protein
MAELHLAEAEADLPFSLALEIADLSGRRLSIAAFQAGLRIRQFLEDDH